MPPSKSWLFFLCLFVACLAGTSVAQSAPLPDGPAPQQQAPKPHDQAKMGGRVLKVVPEFNVVDYSETKPLTPSGKFHLFIRQSLDPFQFVGVGLTSAISQAQDQFPEYGQGALGYGKRYGAGLADNLDGAFWGNFVLPVLLKEDPRYFRLGHGNVWKRIGYAASAAVVVRTDSGHRRPNYSNVTGNLIAGGIANTYYPESDRGLGLTFQRAFVVTAMGAVGGIGQEFLPDLDRLIFHRKKKDVPPTTAAPQP